MTNTETPGALFAGLIFNEAGEPVELSYIGDEAHYVVLDAGFRRHVLARDVDRQILLRMREHMEPYKDEAVEEVMRMMGRDDLFTKAMLDASIKNVDQALDQAVPTEVRTWLGMLGFRVVVDLHGEVVDVEIPGQTGEEWDD
ncbi:MAG: hypothetical protein U9R25_10170 [Chloroflexota bacterium]|nr:hypothetical protein [Chloroflexota bacterium]